MAVTFQCTDCGADWESKVNRTGPRYCAPCIEVRRKNKTGPVQTKRANGELEPTTPQTTVGGGSRAKKASVPTQESLSELAQKLKAKYSSDSETEDEALEIGEPISNASQEGS